MYLKFAAVARSGVHLADRQAAAEHLADLLLELHTHLLERGLVNFRQRLGDDADALDF